MKRGGKVVGTGLVALGVLAMVGWSARPAGVEPVVSEIAPAAGLSAGGAGGEDETRLRLALVSHVAASRSPHPPSPERRQVMRANGMLLDARHALSTGDWGGARELLERHEQEFGARHGSDRTALWHALRCDADPGTGVRAQARGFLADHPEARFQGHVRRSCGLSSRRGPVILVGS